MANPLNLDIDCAPHEPDELEQSIFNILAAYLPHDSPTTPEEAATQIHDIFPYKNPKIKPKDSNAVGWCYAFWHLWFRIAPQLGYRDEPMQRFIALFKTLGELPEIVIKDDDKWYNGRMVWQDKPYYGMMFSERWDMCSPLPKGKDNSNWKNINGLAAHLTNAGLDSNLYFALNCISSGLEKYDGLAAPASAVWVILSAPKIHEACEKELLDRRDTEWLEERARQPFSVARWDAWRNRFVALIDHPDATEETKEMAKAAIEAMEAVRPGSSETAA
ncbi:hypothetical protein MW887_007222 [Aspergillus wentii]|nr:hypothetical protein MW887_007222 [Aspergillus wentii]